MVRLHLRFIALLVAGMLAPSCVDCRAAAFKLQRVIGGLNFPVAVAEAPGETNSIFIAEMVVPTFPYKLGRIWRYNPATKVRSIFLDLSTLVAPNGFNSLLHFAFHPDYATNGKFYVAYQFIGTTNTARLAEYKVIGETPVFQRVIYEHDIVKGTGHVINMALFKPGDPSRHLYILVGDGFDQASTAGYQVNRAQDLRSNYGKLLRVDVADGRDDYPDDPRRNFGIPAANTNLYNPPNRNGEVIASGFRNPWRGAFDPVHGDLYIGDNGMDTAEEVDFIREDVFYPQSVSIPDHGWPATEAIYHPVPGANPFVQSLPVNPASIFPILSRTHGNIPLNTDVTGDGVPDLHGDGDNSVIGGILYRGSINELYGKYIHADFVGARIYASEFDRNTSTALFNGRNVTDLREISGDIKATLAGSVLDKPVSFYSDHAGDLYVLDYGLNSESGRGIVYKLVAVPPVLSQARYTGSQFSFVVTGVTNENYAVDVSTNLVHWMAISTNTPPFTCLDQDAPVVSRRFYRARQLPR